jgi:transposase
MARKQLIKELYEDEEKSLREIARITSLSFQAVQKYAYQSNWNAEQLPNTDPKRYPILGPYIPIIDEWLEDDRKEPRKQRHTITKIFERLQKEHEFTGGYSSVKRYFSKKKFLMKVATAGYLPLLQPMGHTQIDFGEFKYYDGLGRDNKGHALTITFPYSNIGYTQVFKSENQECLLEGMKRIFRHICGVPIRIKADNMTTAVAHVLKGSERELSDGFARFKLHYRFYAEFCNPATGNEKGNVENKVGYSRRNFLVPVPTIDDFESFNEELFMLCEEDAKRNHYKHGVPMCELWEEEKKHLLPLPEYEYQVFRYELARINKYGYVTVDTNKYSVSPELSGQAAQVKIYFDKIEIYCDHALLKIYERSYGKNKEVYDWKQYLPTLCKKPGATPHTRFFDQLPKLWQEHLKRTEGKERKTALMLLSEIVNDGNAAFCDDAIMLASEYGCSDNDSIRQCYYMLSKAENNPKPLSISVATPMLGYNPNLSVYDNLTGGEKFD